MSMKFKILNSGSGLSNKQVTDAQKQLADFGFDSSKSSIIEDNFTD